MIGKSKSPIVLRTDFSDDAAWAAIKAEIGKPVGPDAWLANVAYLDDKAYKGVSEADVRDLLGGYEHDFVILADARSITHPEYALLVIDLSEAQEPSFRAVPGTVQSIENNLSIANMGFEEFADAADEAEDGVFRGFDDED